MNKKLKWNLNHNIDDRLRKLCPVLTKAFKEYHCCVLNSCEWYVNKNGEHQYNKMCSITMLGYKEVIWQ